MKKTEFKGHLALGEQRFPAEFTVSVDDGVRLQVELRPLPIKAHWILHSAMGEVGSRGELLTLEGHSYDGGLQFSGRVGIRELSSGDREALLKVSARESKIVSRADPPAETPRIRSWFRGFKSFHAPLVTMSLGLVEVRGGTGDVEPDDVSGYMTLQAQESVDLEAWMSRADEFLTFMLRGLGFVNGGRLQSPLVDRVVGNRWERTYYDGSGHPSYLAPVPFLHQGPIIEALVRRFDDHGPVPDMLWTAVGWMHNDSPYGEGNFLMCMTALECVVEHLLSEKLTRTVPKKAFRPIREAIVEALAGLEIDATARKIFEARIDILNSRALSQKIIALRDYHGLSQNTFTDKAIVGLVEARNGIVHRGKMPGPGDVWQEIIFVRDLITQIVFREIGYSGPYERYVGGYRYVHPEAVPRSEAPSSEVSFNE